MAGKCFDLDVPKIPGEWCQECPWLGECKYLGQPRKPLISFDDEEDDLKETFEFFREHVIKEICMEKEDLIKITDDLWAKYVPSIDAYLDKNGNVYNEDGVNDGNLFDCNGVLHPKLNVYLVSLFIEKNLNKFLDSLGLGWVSKYNYKEKKFFIQFIKKLLEERYRDTYGHSMDRRQYTADELMDLFLRKTNGEDPDSFREFLIM